MTGIMKGSLNNAAYIDNFSVSDRFEKRETCFSVVSGIKGNFGERSFSALFLMSFPFKGRIFLLYMR